MEDVIDKELTVSVHVFGSGFTNSRSFEVIVQLRSEDIADKHDRDYDLYLDVDSLKVQ